MPKSANKHRNIKPDNISNVPNGMNVAQIPELLQETEAQLIQNFEFIGNRLWTRGGLSAPIYTFPANIKGVFYDYEMNTYLVFLVNKDVYKYVLTQTPLLLGTLLGDNKPVCCKFGGKVLIASGNKLQSYDYTNLTMIDSPVCDQVYERFGRILIVKAGTDTIYYSAVGDETSWTDDPNDDSSAKDVEIGYKDGGDIVGIALLSTDIIVFKDNGKIYQLANEFPDWAVYLVGTNSDFVYQFGLSSLGNDITYMSRRGLRSLSTSMEYGNFKSGDIGSQVNIQMMVSIFHPHIWNLKRKKQMIIRPDESSTVWAYHYAQEAFTIMTFPSTIVDMVESPNGVIVAIGASLYEWSQSYATDNGTPIVAKLISRKVISVTNMLTKKVSISVNGTTGNATFTINNKSVPFSWTPSHSRRDYLLQVRAKEFVYQFQTTDQMSFNHLYVEIAT